MVVNVFLFDEFEVMDAFGPRRFLGMCRSIFTYVLFHCVAA